MIQEKTIARPYAQAVFEIATQDNEVAKWLGGLGAFSLLKENTDVADFLNTPGLSSQVAENTVNQLIKHVQKSHAQQLKDLVTDTTIDSSLPATWSNFIQLLHHKGRLSALSEISLLFIEKVREANSILPVLVQSANVISNAEVTLLKENLTKKFDKKINLTVEIKPELIGGAMIHVGDTVIDGSVKGKLESMTQSLIN